METKLTLDLSPMTPEEFKDYAESMGMTEWGRDNFHILDREGFSALLERVHGTKHPVSDQEWGVISFVINYGSYPFPYLQHEHDRWHAKVADLYINGGISALREIYESAIEVFQLIQNPDSRFNEIKDIADQIRAMRYMILAEQEMRSFVCEDQRPAASFAHDFIFTGAHQIAMKRYILDKVLFDWEFDDLVVCEYLGIDHELLQESEDYVALHNFYRAVIKEMRAECESERLSALSP